MEAFFDQTNALFPAVGAVAGLAIAAGQLWWRKWRIARRTRRIERAGSVEEWQKAKALAEPPEKDFAWPKLMLDAALGAALGITVLFADDALAVPIALLAWGVLSLMGDRILRRIRPDLYEQDDPEPDGDLDSGFFGNYVPSEARWGFVAALGMVAMIIGAIWLFA